MGPVWLVPFPLTNCTVQMQANCPLLHPWKVVHCPRAQSKEMRWLRNHFVKSDGPAWSKIKRQNPWCSRIEQISPLETRRGSKLHTFGSEGRSLTSQCSYKGLLGAETSGESKDSAPFIVYLGLFRKSLETTSKLVSNSLVTCLGTVSIIFWRFGEYSMPYWSMALVIFPEYAGKWHSFAMPSRSMEWKPFSFSWECPGPFHERPSVSKVDYISITWQSVHSRSITKPNSLPVH